MIKTETLNTSEVIMTCQQNEKADWTSAVATSQPEDQKNSLLNSNCWRQLLIRRQRENPADRCQRRFIWSVRSMYFQLHWIQSCIELYVLTLGKNTMFDIRAPNIYFSDFKQVSATKLWSSVILETYYHIIQIVATFF